MKCANRMLPRILLAAKLTSTLSQNAVIDSNAAKTTTVLNLLIPLLVAGLPRDFPMAITWAGEQLLQSMPGMYQIRSCDHVDCMQVIMLWHC